MTSGSGQRLEGAALARAVFSPRSVALVGASGDPGKASSRPLAYLRRDGFSGRVFPVNRSGSIGGHDCWTDVAALPEIPDHAFVMTPRAAVLDVVEQCGRSGVGVVTVLSGGFGEAGPQGAAEERRLRAVAREHGVRLIGPSSLGVVHPALGLTLTGNAAFDEPAPAGGVFVASHSGSMIGGLLSRGAARGVGFSRLVSVGGEADVSLGELCLGALDDDDVTGYLLFLESLRHAGDLQRFARAAAERDKPVVAYKLGRSAVAAELARSHTGALAGEDVVADAFLADSGIARVHTLDGLLETLPLLQRLPARRRTGGVGVLTTTGGGAAMVVDQLGVRGVPVVSASPETRGRLASAGIRAEPGAVVDLTLAGARPDVVAAALEVPTSAPEFDLVVVVVGSSARSRPELAVAPVVEHRGSSTPVAAFVVPEAPEALRDLASAGVPAFRTPESCADAVAAALARRCPRPGPEARACHHPVSIRTHDEAAAAARLREHGVPVAPFAVVDVGDEGPRDGVRYPVAVKALADGLLHKSDAGGVVLGVPDPAAVPEAARAVRDAVARSAGPTVRRVLVQEMRTGRAEALVGYRLDPEVGPLVLVAAGGLLAELHDDRAVRLAPVDEETARAMLDEVTGLAVLRGFRGAPEGDLGALARLVVSVSQLAAAADVVEAELNPVLVGPAGDGVVAVDAVLRTAIEEEESDG